MPICKHCGEPIYQTRGGSWMHMDGRRCPHFVQRLQPDDQRFRKPWGLSV